MSKTRPPYAPDFRERMVDLGLRAFTSWVLKSWLNRIPDARKLSLPRMWKESRMGPVGLKHQGGSSNHVGVWLKYIWVSLSHLLGPTREAPRSDSLRP